MRADRLLSILLLLQTRHRQTARELAKRLEVSERTIQRDMESLGIAGVPVVAERGLGGGWRLLEPYRTNLTGLNEDEIQALFVTRPAQLLTDLGLKRASEAALIKLLAVLPAGHRRDAEYARQRIFVDSASWSSKEESVPVLPLLQEAVWQERKLTFSYPFRQPNGEEARSERFVDPLGLVSKGSIWYLIAALGGALRTYRVSRISEVRISDEPCVRPDDFDLAAYWVASSASFRANLPRYSVTLRMSPSAFPHVHSAGRFVEVERVEPPDAEGWRTVYLLFTIEEEACGYLLSFGAEVEVLEPRPLRARIVTLARELLAFYEREEPGLFEQESTL